MSRRSIDAKFLNWAFKTNIFWGQVNAVQTAELEAVSCRLRDNKKLPARWTVTAYISDKQGTYYTFS